MSRPVFLKRLVLFSFLMLFILPNLRCGGGAPPASIPAPVSSLLSISPPDQTGAVAINGAPNSVFPNATVQAANTSQGGTFSLLDWLIPSAQAQVFSVNTTADDQGAFSLLIDGQSGDVIELRQELNGDVSDVTQLVVP